MSFAHFALSIKFSPLDWFPLQDEHIHRFIVRFVEPRVFRDCFYALALDIKVPVNMLSVWSLALSVSPRALPLRTEAMQPAQAFD